MTVIPTPRPAATVVVARPSSNEDSTEIEVFLVKRHHKSGFMANAHVFPGGRVEPQDAAFARGLSPERLSATAALIDGEDDAITAAAFAIASIRETAEECGVVLARTKDGLTASQHVADAVVTALREADPAPFATILATHSLEIDLEGLAPLAWWLTPTAEPKRYDTRFFAAWAPAGQRAAADLIETTAGDWYSPTAALRAYQADEIHLAPPTLVTLEDLAGVTDLAALRDRIARPVCCVCPRLTETESLGMVLALPGDPLHAADGEAKVAPIVGWDRTRIVQDSNGRFISASHKEP